MPDAPLVVWLRRDGPAAPVAGLLGGKAAALARLIRSGHPVPRAAVLTTAAYEAAAATPPVVRLVGRLRGPPTAQIDGARGHEEPIHDDEIDRAFLDAPLPEGVVRAIAELATSFHGPVAVRSSATAEDLTSAAFAGQYRSMLGVDPADLEHAVRLVWASLWHRAPRAYRRARGIEERDPTMAVLVMEMIEPVSAGVLFTRDPVGDASNVRLEAVAGRGEALVSGAVTPTARTWPRSEATLGAASSAPALGELVDRALALEAAWGAPLDIEYAIDGEGRLWLVQARPVTAMAPAGFGASTLTRAGIAEMLPGVLPPLLQETAGRYVDEGFRNLVAELGADLHGDDRFVRFESSRALLDLGTLRRAAATTPGGSVGALDRGYGIETGATTAAPARTSAVTSAAQLARVLRRRRAAVVESEIVVQAVDRLVEDDGGECDDLAGVLARWERVQDLGNRATTAEMAVAALATAAYEGVQRTLTRHVGPERARELTQRLTTRARRRSGPLDRSVLASGRDPSHPMTEGAWADVLARAGSRSVFGGPTWSEDPDLARSAYDTNLVDGDAAGHADLLRSIGCHRSGNVRAGLTRVRRRFVAREAADAAELLDRRERTKSALLDLGGIAHRLTVELADRLTARGQLRTPDDIWLLTPSELRAACATGAGPADLAQRRAALEADRAAEAAATMPTGHGRGWPASPGSARGRAVVVDVPRAGAIERGDVLVARTTDAGWVPLFALAGAVVVEEGGPLSHAAIVARELGVPAVVNVPGIVERIRTAGPEVTLEVDGTTGAVTILDDRLVLAPVIAAPEHEPRLGVFVTGLIGASALFGVVVSVTEAVSSARGIRRTRARAAIPATLLADVVRGGTATVGRSSVGLPPARRYGRWVVALLLAGLVLSTVATTQYVVATSAGRIVWLITAMSTTLAWVIGVRAVRTAERRWPDVPPGVRRVTPRPRRHERHPARLQQVWSELPMFHRRWFVVFASTAFGLLVMNLVAPATLHAIDEPLYDAIGAPDPDRWAPGWFGMYFGRPQVVIPVALLVALFTVRCRVLAVAYPLTIMFGGLLNLGIGLLVGKERPPYGPHAGQTDSFPSGHAIEVTLLLGLVPLAVAVLLRSRWAGRVTRVAASGILLVMLADGLRDGSHWPSDHLGGFAIAMTAVVLVHALARTPSLHSSCSRCPAVALLPHTVPDVGGGSMNASVHTSSFLLGRRPLLPLAPEVVRLLHRFSLIWAMATVALLELTGWMDLLDHRPGYSAAEVTVRPLFVGLFVVGAVLAWKWEILGGVLATFTAAGMLVWYGHQLAAWNAVIVLFAFSLPGIAWLLLDLHDQPPRLAVLGVVFALFAGTAGYRVGHSYWDDFFGPSHPASTATQPVGTRVHWIWTGGVTTTSATIVAQPDGGDDDWSVVIRDVETGAEKATAEGVADGEVVRFEVTGLRPGTAYGVELVGADDSDDDPGVEEARFTTFPEGRADVSIAVGSCARVGTNGAVFDAIAALDPTVFIEDGDFHYSDIGTNDPDEFQDVLDLTLSRPGPSNLFRSVPIAYVWDDHDYGGNNADATSPSRPAAMQVYRQYVPSYVTNGPDDPIYQAFDVGDVRVIMTDPRSARTPSQQVDDADKSMLGAEQKSWLEAELLAARDTHALTVWVNPVAWIAEAMPGGDGWDGYSTERRELANFIVDHDIDRLVMLSGDAHMVAIDDGTHTGYADGGGPTFPVLHAAALDRPGHTKGGPYTEGPIMGGGQFGLVEISYVDDGVHVRLSGRDWTGATLLAYEVTFPIE